mgnify:CR=1 FL=1
MKVSRIKIAIKNSFTLTLTLLTQEIIQIGVIKVVKTINNIDMPSTPSLNFIKLFIQDFSSTNWNSEVLISKEYHKNNERKKVATLLNKEIEIELTFVVLSLDKKMKKELTKGKKIKVDNIGKFILF